MTIIWQSFFLGTRFLKTWQTEIEKTILKIDGRKKIILKMKEEGKRKRALSIASKMMKYSYLKISLLKNHFSFNEKIIYFIKDYSIVL